MSVKMRQPHHFTPERAAEAARLSHQSRRVNTLERRIRELVESAPPLPQETRDRLAGILRGAAA
jgi:hypothetical protein